MIKYILQFPIIAILIFSCGEVPENKKSVWEPEIQNMGHLAIQQIFDDLSDDKKYYNTYEVNFYHNRKGLDVDGVLYLTIPKGLYEDAKKMGKGNYPQFSEYVEINLYDALVSTRYDEKVYLDLTGDLEYKNEVQDDTPLSDNYRILNKEVDFYQISNENNKLRTLKKGTIIELQSPEPMNNFYWVIIVNGKNNEINVGYIKKEAID